MSKGLTLARAFNLSGHRVIGADFESVHIPCSGRYSSSITAFYPLSKPSSSATATTHVQQIMGIIKRERVDLWVSCSGVATALEDAEAKEAIEQQTRCKAIQFGVQTTSTLHEKDSFMHHLLDLGLPCPKTYQVTSQKETLRILEGLRAQLHTKFILKPVHVDDVNRGNMKLLPFRCTAENESYVSSLPISPSKPWILQEFIPGGEEYCTHALIVGGEVRCFTACPSAELLMHYKALPSNSALFQAMLHFTREFVNRSRKPESLTGHLSFDFMVRDGVVNEKNFDRMIYAIECNPRAHTAVVLFAQPGVEMEAMVQAYLSVIDARPESMDKRNGLKDQLVVPPIATVPRYWLGHDLVSLLLHPAIRLASGIIEPVEFFNHFLQFLTHVLIWKEGTFEVWDPAPALALYHIFWPLTILSAWWCGQDWSRVNVSTTKMFLR